MKKLIVLFALIVFIITSLSSCTDSRYNRDRQNQIVSTKSVTIPNRIIVIERKFLEGCVITLISLDNKEYLVNSEGGISPTVTPDTQ